MRNIGRVQTVGFADPKLLRAYQELKNGTFEDRRLHSNIAEAIKTLKNNPEAGPKIPRPLWPHPYIRAYGIDNLHKIALPDGWRITYTLKGSRIEVTSVILEWMTHKRYEKRFGYKVG